LRGIGSEKLGVIRGGNPALAVVSVPLRGIGSEKHVITKKAADDLLIVSVPLRGIGSEKQSQATLGLRDISLEFPSPCGE